MGSTSAKAVRRTLMKLTPGYFIRYIKLNGHNDVTVKATDDPAELVITELVCS